MRRLGCIASDGVNWSILRHTTVGKAESSTPGFLATKVEPSEDPPDVSIREPEQCRSYTHLKVLFTSTTNSWRIPVAIVPCNARNVKGRSLWRRTAFTVGAW